MWKSLDCVSRKNALCHKKCYHKRSKKTRRLVALEIPLILVTRELIVWTYSLVTRRWSNSQKQRSAGRPINAFKLKMQTNIRLHLAADQRVTKWFNTPVSVFIRKANPSDIRCTFAIACLTGKDWLEAVIMPLTCLHIFILFHYAI